MDETLILEFDGGSRGNPGPAAIGVVVRAEDGTPLVTLGRPIGRATNNVAEYQALIAAMKEALRLGATKIAVRGDSEFVVKQMRGEYRVKHPNIIPLYAEASKLYRQFAKATITHNFREKNALADKLANLAMDRNSEVTDVDGDVAPPAPIAAPPALAAGTEIRCSRCGCSAQIKRASSASPAKLRAFTCQCGERMK